MKFRVSNMEDINWFFSKVSYTPSLQFGGITAVSDGGSRMGVVGFDHWTPNSVQCHVAASNPKCLANLWQEVLSFVGKNGRRLVYAVTPSDNVRSLRLQKAVGFSEVFRITDGWSDGVDMVINEYRLNEQGH